MQPITVDRLHWWITRRQLWIQVVAVSTSRVSSDIDFQTESPTRFYIVIQTASGITYRTAMVRLL